MHIYSNGFKWEKQLKILICLLQINILEKTGEIFKLAVNIDSYVYIQINILEETEEMFNLAVKVTGTDLIQRNVIL